MSRQAAQGVENTSELREIYRRMAEPWSRSETTDLLHSAFALDRRTAVVSSFGTEAAVLLALVAEIKPDADVVFIDTLRHFGETHRYREKLSSELGLRNIRVVRPDPGVLLSTDPDEMLFRGDPDGCCRIRKVEPLREALKDIEIWITGRKRYQSDTRSDLRKVEWAGERIKVNPLADWTQDRIVEEFRVR
ncbi:MAG TPA: phosphoadenylyl-sulfate reductase, partial [Lacipirellulaceae bacterium]|nr:phosphoadenylyl-sulfate reductase [Lacipirellulaceae bacterium]